MVDDSPVWQQPTYGSPSLAAYLPNEILEHIFLHLSPVSLAAVTAVTSSWNAVAERLLYANISVVDIVSQHQHQPQYDPYHYQPPLPLQPWRTVRVCQSLLRRPHLAEGVRRLHIRWHGVVAGARTPALLEHVYRYDITAAVRVLPNLESLDLALGLARDAVLDCSSLFHDEHRQPHDQPQFEHMKHLALSGVSGHAMHIHPHALPSLISFRGSPTTAASIVPGRAVHTLALIGHAQDAIAEDDLRTLAVGCAPLLRELDLSSMSVTPALLSHLAAHFPTIELLRVKLALRHTLHYALSGIVSLPFHIFSHPHYIFPFYPFFLPATLFSW
jgi:hypothetical protein